MKSNKIIPALVSLTRLLPTLLLLDLLNPLASWAREVIDVTQTPVSIVDHPKRIITLIPSLAELAAEALDGQNEKIVGVSSHSDIPPSLVLKPIIGTYNKLNLEAILQLHPDLILGSNDGNPPLELKRLREMGQPLVIVNTSTLKQVEESIRLVYTACGAPTAGQVQAEKFKQELEKFRNFPKNRKALRVLLEVAETPLIVAGKGSYLSDIVQLIGAQNIYADSPTSYPRPSLEDVMVKNPEVVLILGSERSAADHKQLLQFWNRFPKLSAVKNRRVQILKEQALVRPTPRLLKGIAALEKELYAQNLPE